jgi:DNA-binding transcriptional regulator YiaG
MPGKRKTKAVYRWDDTAVQELRKHLGSTQGELAEELGVRQQTVSEWETGVYQPTGASVKLLTIVAERAGFTYTVGEAAKTTTPLAEPNDAAS